MLRSMAIIAVPLATITLLVGIILILFLYQENRDRARNSAEAAKTAQQAAQDAALLTLRLDEERLARENVLAWQVYDNCVENESQDAANTELYRKVRALIVLGPPNPQRDALIDSLTDTINAREPEGEKDCIVPNRPRPTP